jgi:hypothetical protein
MNKSNAWIWLAVVGLGAFVLCNGDVRCTIAKTLRFIA